MKALLIQENSWKIEIKPFPLCATPHQNQSPIYSASHRRPTRPSRIQWWHSLFPPQTGSTLPGKIWLKNQNKWNSILMFIFSVLYLKHPFCYPKVNEAQLLSLLSYGSRDFKIGSCPQHGFFVLLLLVRSWIVFVHCLKLFN